MASQLSRIHRLYLVISVSLMFFLAEISVGFYTKSLALVADAFHYLNDLVGFIVALVALQISSRKDSPKELSFGWQRAQLLGAFFNGVFLLALGVSIFLQSIERFISLQRVENPKLILIIGCIGLALNIISAIFLHEHDHGTPIPSKAVELEEVVTNDEASSAHKDHRHGRHQPNKTGHDLGMLGVLIHVIGDAMNNLGVIISALVIWLASYGGRFYADPAVSMVISFMIFTTSLPLVKKSGTILLESVPSGVDPSDIQHDLELIPGVKSVHELHVWCLNQQKSLASVHILLSDCMLSEFVRLSNTVNECFHSYGIHSATIQPELVVPPTATADKSAASQAVEMTDNTTAKLSSLQEFISPLSLSDATLYRLAYQLSQTYKTLAASSREQFFPTPVTHLPTGQEKGRYLAVYVGLFYLHVGFIELPGGQANRNGASHHHHNHNGMIQPDRQRVRRTLEKAWPIDERLKIGHAKDLFSWIGNCIAEVVQDSMRSESETDTSTRELVTGISFCFPIMQKSLDEAILMPTGKGFGLESDLNLRQALLDGYECHIRPPTSDEENGSESSESEAQPRSRTAKRRRHFSLPKLRIAAMTNDTVATFASLAYSIKSLPNSRVVMGLMVGAGCNATVPMKLSNLHASKTEFIRAQDPSAKETLVSTEWTLRRSSMPVLDMNLMTRWDKEVEARSQRPGFQPLEYMVGGRYVGELIRVIVLDYFTRVLNTDRDVLPWRLLEVDGLTTDFLSLNVASASPSGRDDESLAYELTQRLPSTKGWIWNAEKAGVLRTVAAAVQTRATALIAAATVGLLSCTGEIQLKNPDSTGEDTATSTTSTNAASSPKEAETKTTTLTSSRRDWNNGPEELVVAFCGGVIQNYPHYKDNMQRQIDRLLVHGGPQEGGKSIFLREVSDGGIVGVGVLAGSVMGGIEGIVGSNFLVK
ncbi:hypothetical protein PISL3812_08643 [Talaromyces islandicus]|uniref:Hexokinase n=1 Tax=Talaromyces islandicus TaxID=28573 RepID=A0A0U1M7K5_TALIS|nr:hypothetical protein PISL3812_08643 [Talaromyces islandicus]